MAHATLVTARRMIGTGSILLLIGCGSEPAPGAPPPAGSPPAESSPVQSSGGGLVPDTKPVPVVKWVEMSVPKGTALRLNLIDTLGSRESRKGDTFRALVTNAVMVDGTVTVPSGSNVMGTVKDVVGGAVGFEGRGGMISLEFNKIDTPTGASAPVKAALSELESGRTHAVLSGAPALGRIVAGSPGKEALLESTTPMTVVLEEPLVIRVKQ